MKIVLLVLALVVLTACRNTDEPPYQNGGGDGPGASLGTYQKNFPNFNVGNLRFENVRISSVDRDGNLTGRIRNTVGTPFNLEIIVTFELLDAEGQILVNLPHPIFGENIPGNSYIDFNASIYALPNLTDVDQIHSISATITSLG
jgi:hypothetical protein